MVEMTSVDWQLSLKVVNQPKSTFHFPEMMPGDVPPGEYRVATLKQLVAAQLPDTVNDPELIEPVNRATAAREFRVFHAALHSVNTAYKDSVYKMLTNKESLDQIIVATPGLKSDAVALGVLQDKDLFVQFTDPNMLDMLISSHPALVNAIILVLHSVAGSMPTQPSSSSSRNVSASSYSDMPGGFMFDGMSDDEEEFQSGNQAGPSSRGSAAAGGVRPVSLSHSGATGPRPITQSELATALALASTPDSSAATPTTNSQVRGRGHCLG
ncbi:hypothetical protein CRUP_020802 [Coryphaenoides rupestris]|nr:hypothetical protein CRUP_020802 [Coryphaenoides rupestris]